MARRSPVVYLSHGAPPLAEDATWKRELAELAAGIGRPEAVLIVSAHWEAAPLTLAATEPVPLLYDFGGFPERFYHVRYAAPGAPELAEQVRKLLRAPGTPVYDDPARGLDHGAYVPLKEMYPAADVPVLQVSMPTLDPAELYRIGQKLTPLRDQGVLIVGSGFTTHNLREIDLGGPSDAAAPAWSVEFDDWARRAMADHDVDALLDFLHRGPAATVAHPRTEHFAPLFVALGAAGDATAASVIDGFWYGLSKRTWRLG